MELIDFQFYAKTANVKWPSQTTLRIAIFRTPNQEKFYETGALLPSKSVQLRPGNKAYSLLGSAFYKVYPVNICK
jgi:hypothetical protein